MHWAKLFEVATESSETSSKGLSALEEVAAFEGLDLQHDEIWDRRCSGSPPEHLQRSGDTHMRSENVVMTSGIGVAQLAIHCSPA